ncbi:capsular polysaccharide export protein [Caballeronia udeis]|uniref:Capsular polysaccharide export protein n=1 Tax=Caballeronia udeis TaxID=1232866 RepID=A0ABW8MHG6_9BURK
MTKIVTLVYYHSMARFFCGIEDAWKQFEPDAEFLHLAVFPSAWAYLKVHGRQTAALSWQSYLTGNLGENGTAANTPAREIEAMIRFHASDPNIKPARTMALRRQAQKMLRTCKSIVTKFDPDIAIISGDTRLPAESLMRALKDRKTVSWYFEQGPYRTTVLDRQGVNANCSFRRELARLEASGPPLPPRANSARWTNKLYTFLDRFAFAQARITRLMPPDLRPYTLHKCPQARYARLRSTILLQTDPCKVVLVAMQVPEDANNIYHNPLGLDDVGLLKFVLDNVEPGWSVVVREHPLYRRKYSPPFYALVDASDNVVLSQASLQQDIDRSRTTVTVNSLTGLDAFAHGHRVILLGESFYDHLPGIDTLRSGVPLRTLLTRDHPPGTDKPASLLGPLIDRYFFKGHFTDVDLSFTRTIAQQIAHDSRVAQ